VRPSSMVRAITETHPKRTCIRRGRSIPAKREPFPTLQRCWPSPKLAYAVLPTTSSLVLLRDRSCCCWAGTQSPDGAS
jgi:hypothetical protein